MFQIGEFSKLTQITIRMLRYYDEAGLLKPAEIDPWTGYRMYSADQIPVLNKIIYLRDSGFTVSEIAEALNMEDDSSLVTQLDRKKLEVEQTIQVEQEKLNKIEFAKNELLNIKKVKCIITFQLNPYQVVRFFPYAAQYRIITQRVIYGRVIRLCI